MSKIIKVEVHYADKVDKIFVKRLKYSQQMRMLAVLNQNSFPTKDENGKPVLDKDGDRVITRNPESVGSYQLQTIALCVCDEKGKPLFKPEEIDDWSEEDGGTQKVMAYMKAINLALLPKSGEVAGNSKPTPTDSSSSV